MNFETNRIYIGVAKKLGVPYGEVKLAIRALLTTMQAYRKKGIKDDNEKEYFFRIKK